MEYRIYLDVLFFWNFVLDSLILIQTQQLFSSGRQALRTTWAGRLAAAASGGLGSCFLTVLYGLPFFLKVLLFFPGLSLWMVWIGFRKSRKGGKKQFWKQYFVFLGDTFLLGGLVLFLQYRFRLSTAPSVAFAACLSEAGILISRRLRWEKTHIYPVCLTYQGRQIQTQGFYDTGNHLVCPWNQKGVHVVNEACLWEGSTKDGCQASVPELAEGFFYVPFSSVGKEGGLLKATQADVLQVFFEEGELRIEKPIVALGAASLFCGQPYEILLHSGITKEAEKNQRKKGRKKCL